MNFGRSPFIKLLSLTIAIVTNFPSDGCALGSNLSNLVDDRASEAFELNDQIQVLKDSFTHEPPKLDFLGSPPHDEQFLRTNKEFLRPKQIHRPANRRLSIETQNRNKVIQKLMDRKRRDNERLLQFKLAQWHVEDLVKCFKTSIIEKFLDSQENSPLSKVEAEIIKRKALTQEAVDSSDIFPESKLIKLQDLLPWPYSEDGQKHQRQKIEFKEDAFLPRRVEFSPILGARDQNEQPKQLIKELNNQLGKSGIEEQKSPLLEDLSESKSHPALEEVKDSVVPVSKEKSRRKFKLYKGIRSKDFEKPIRESIHRTRPARPKSGKTLALQRG